MPLKHKGFFDILNLVNNPASRPAASGFKATFSKATGRFRRDSNPVGNGRTAITAVGGGKDDPFFSSPAPPLQPVNINSHSPTHVALNTKRSTMPAAASTPGAGTVPSYSPAPAVLGPRAAKKRISVDMVGAPRIDSFVHAAHASDADQAEEILRRWGRDNVGKIAGKLTFGTRADVDI